MFQGDEVLSRHVRAARICEILAPEAGAALVAAGAGAGSEAAGVAGGPLYLASVSFFRAELRM